MCRVKSMLIGSMIGIAAGAVIGASNCNLICEMLRKGKKEIKKMKKRYRLMY